MNRVNAPNQMLLLLATGPLFACSTSVFAAVITIGVVLACTAVAAIATKFTAAPACGKISATRLAIATTTSAFIVSAALIVLVTRGFSDIVAGFAPQMILAAFCAALIAAGNQPGPATAQTCLHIAIAGILCELLGRGTLLGDYELAFAGATHAGLLRVVDFAPLPWLATPAGALMVAAAIAAGFSLRQSSDATHDNAGETITEPRSGRRVRVTGHIS